MISPTLLVVRTNLSPHLERYQSDSSIADRFLEWVSPNPAEYEVNMNLISGLLIQVHTGQFTETRRLFMYRGGMFITRRFHLPDVTIERLSHISLMCQFFRYVVSGSRTGHDWRTKLNRLCSATYVLAASTRAWNSVGFNLTSGAEVAGIRPEFFLD